MTYNKQSSLANQKSFLRTQAHCGYPNIERTAKQTLAKIEANERKQAEFDKQIRLTNAQLAAQRMKKDFKASKQKKHTHQKK